MTNCIRVLYEFATVEDAQTYRHTFGTGGWIFVPDSGLCVLFPQGMLPSAIMKHPITYHRSGILKG